MIYMITDLVFVDDAGIHTLEARKCYNLPHDWTRALIEAEVAAEVVRI